MQFGHDETWTAVAPGAVTVFFFEPSPDGSKSIAEVTWKNGALFTSTTSLGSGGEFLMSALVDVDGDGIPECVLSENNGRMLVVRAGRGIIAEWMTGFRLQLEGFSAARPGPVPVVYRSPSDRSPCITIPDNTWTLHQLRAGRGAGGATLAWKKRGRGWMGYDNAFHSVYVHDVDDDGVNEVMAVNPDRADCSELCAFTPDGVLKNSWIFAGVPPPAPTRIGVYAWVVTGADGGRTIAASAYRSYSMNSEQTIAIDIEGRPRWNRVEYGEGEWGRGVGPWSASSVVAGTGAARHILFLAKDLLCRVDANSGEWIKEPWILWRATNSVMNQPDWDFTKDRQADFGTAKDPFTAYGSPIIIDADNDGKDEILVAGCFGGYGILRDDYSILWWKRTPFTDMMLRLPGIADVRGDGRLCIGVCRSNGTFQCIEAATGDELWSMDLRATTADIASCDIDGDGKEEFIAGTTDGRLLALGTDGAGKGAIRWSLDLGTGLGNPVVADVDGDGSSEILVVCGDGRMVCVGKGA
jgi:outer membrane protein assembly factor BamB